jgi:hypothetical protein
VRKGERFTFSVAGPADEPDLRRLVGETVMPGSIAIRFEREPDYFMGCGVMGDVCDVLIARHVPDGELAGVVCRSERDVFVNGRVRRVGSIGQVRVGTGHRGRWLLHRGLPLLWQLGPADLLYWGVVARENPRARAVMLERRPPGRARARRLSCLTTHALLLRRGHGAWRPAGLPGGVMIRGARSEDLEALVGFLHRTGPRRQLFPVWSTDDFTAGRTTRGLALEDIGLAWRGHEVVGTLALWDQTGFKQDVVHAYPPLLRRLRPAWSVLAGTVGAPTLPPESGRIPSAFAALACVKDDDRRVMRALLEWVGARAAGRGLDFLLLGLADEDPLLASVGWWPHITYRSDLFCVSWAEQVPGGQLDERVPHVEIGTL